MNRLVLVLLLAVGLTSGASASILPVQKAKGSFGLNSTVFKQLKAKKGNVQVLLGPATSAHLVADSLKNQRITAALLTISLGFLGVHRIYLGTKPHIPIIYIATIGGCFGILPFIDFVVLLLSEDASPFINNSRVFMWNKPKKDN